MPKKTSAQLQQEIDQALAERKPSSVWPVIGKHGAGTYDVTTADGAYWIVPVPTGYRIDYKPWDSRDEIDLGRTFRSIHQARAAITKHHRDLLRGK